MPPQKGNSTSSSARKLAAAATAVPAAAAAASTASDDEEPATLSVTVTKKPRGRPPKRKATTTSEDGVEQEVLNGSKANKRAKKAPVKGKNNNKSGLDVQVEGEKKGQGSRATEVQSDFPTLEQLKDQSIYRVYKKFKLPELGVDGEEADPEETTFGVGDICEIRADGKEKLKWLARIDHIGAIDQTRVFIAVTWFYHPSQLPKMANKPRTEPGEIFLSDHVDILETSNVETHVSVGHHTDLPDNCDYFYRKMVVFNPAPAPKKNGGRGRPKTVKVPYITDQVEGED